MASPLTPAHDSPFHDLAEFLAIPRLTGLVLAPDGGRLVATVQQLSADQARYQSSLWQLDPAGVAAPRRLTHSEPGETVPVFTADGSVLFLSKRPGPSGEVPDEPALWRLPPQGEAVRIAHSPAGLSGPIAAAAAPVYVVATDRLAGADAQADAQWRRDREASKVTAILHDGFPIRRWDHELGPDHPRLLAGRTDDGAAPRDLTPDAGTALRDAEYHLAPDGTAVVATWSTREPRGETRTGLVVIEVATGFRRTLLDEPGAGFSRPVISPDGGRVAATELVPGDVGQPWLQRLRVVDLAVGASREFDLSEELHFADYQWSPDGATLYLTGDRQGRGAVLALDVATGAHRLVASDAVYSSLSVAPDGRYLYALRSTVDCPPQPVRLDAAGGPAVRLPSPAPQPALPGRLVEVEAAAPDGATVRGWLVLPAETSGPAPLQQWIHGGPFGSYNTWSWRWCPWVAAARGWAVLMPDPALSTGYGQEWIARAWPHRTAQVWRDVEALLDVVVARGDIDAGRTACLGASFGGFMANWVAGHTDRFRAIVSHSGIWAADQEHSTTDIADWKTRMIGTPAQHPQWYAENSPHEFVTAITTAMLLIHGRRDYRVPHGESRRLFWDLVSRHDGDPATLPHRFLEFTSENHWVLSPGNSRVWYETIFAFLDWHVRGGEWVPPRLA